MKKARKKHTNKFLDGSKYKVKNKINNTNIQNIHNNSSKYNFLLPRLKAFITDMFLLNMPILYITTYVFLHGKEDFLQNQIAIFLCESLYCFLLFLFFVIKGQTPGFRYAEIMLCGDTKKENKDSNLDMKSKTEKPPKVWQTFVFILAWLFELCFFLWIFAFMRKDKRTLHEILSKTHIIYKPNPVRNMQMK